MQADIRLGELSMFASAPGVGKGQPLSSQVLTPHGWTKMGDLSVGDYVIGSDGRPTEVTGVYDRGILDTYEVEFSDGAKLTVDGDHLWRVREKGDKWSTQRTLDLASNLRDNGGRARYRIPLVDPVRHPRVDLPIHPYTLGVILANGHIACGVDVATNDAEVIEWVAFLDPELEFHETTYATSTCRHWRFSKMAPKLRAMNLYGCKSAQKFIPEQYLTASVFQRRMLLAGLLDCDGSVRPDRGQALYHTTSPMLAEGVRSLVESLGGTAMIQKIDRTGQLHRGVEYRVSISIADNPFRLARKSSRWTKPTRLSRRIESIRHAGQESIRCIAVAASDRLYVTERYLVTHNSILALHLAIQIQLPTLYISADTSAHTMGVRAVSMLTGEMVPTVDKMMRVEPSFYDKVLSAGVQHIVFDFNTSPSMKDIQEATESFAVMYGDFPHLIVVDNLRNIYSPEDDTAAQQHNTEDLKVLAGETGSAVLLLQHVTGAFEDGSVVPTLSALENKTGKFPALVLTLSIGKQGDLRVSLVKNRYGPASPAGRLSVFLPWNTSIMSVG